MALGRPRGVGACRLLGSDLRRRALEEGQVADVGQAVSDEARLLPERAEHVLLGGIGKLLGGAFLDFRMSRCGLAACVSPSVSIADP